MYESWSRTAPRTGSAQARLNTQHTQSLKNPNHAIDVAVCSRSITVRDQGMPGVEQTLARSGATRSDATTQLIKLLQCRDARIQTRHTILLISRDSALSWRVEFSKEGMSPWQCSKTSDIPVPRMPNARILKSSRRYSYATAPFAKIAFDRIWSITKDANITAAGTPTSSAQCERADRPHGRILDNPFKRSHNISTDTHKAHIQRLQPTLNLTIWPMQPLYGLDVYLS